MAWDGGGTFARVHNFSADASAGIQAQAARFDAEFDGFKTGLENCQTLTGETTPTANLPMGGFRHVGVAAAVSSDNYLRADDNSKQVGIYVVDVNTTTTGKASASATIFPAALVDGQRITVQLKAQGSAGTNRVMIVNGLSANVVDAWGSAIPGNVYGSGSMVDMVYSSTQAAWQVLTQPTNFAPYNVLPIAVKANTTAGVATTISIQLKRHNDVAWIAFDSTISISVSISADAIRLIGIPEYFTPAVGDNHAVGGTFVTNDGSNTLLTICNVDTGVNQFEFIPVGGQLFSATVAKLYPFTAPYNLGAL